MLKRKDPSYLSPSEIDDLEWCFATILAAQNIDRQTERAQIVARALIDSYRRGVRRPEDLIRLADIPGG